MFDDRMDLGGLGNGVGGFAVQLGGLEPMAEIDMDMDMETEGAENGFTHTNANGKYNTIAGTSPSEADDGDEHDHDNENEQDHEQGSPESISDASSLQDQCANTIFA